MQLVGKPTAGIGLHPPSIIKIIKTSAASRPFQSMAFDHSSTCIASSFLAPIYLQHLYACWLNLVITRVEWHRLSMKSSGGPWVPPLKMNSFGLLALQSSKLIHGWLRAGQWIKQQFWLVCGHLCLISG